MSCVRPSLTVLAILILGGFGIVSSTNAENWPAWRGPRGDGISQETSLPVRWSPEKGIRWKSVIEGRGHSSPIVWENALFITSADEANRNRVLWRIDAQSGNVVWKKEVLHAPLEDVHPLNSYASATPATDGNRVFVTFLNDHETFVAAYDFDGNKRWQASPGPFASKHGFCSSPVIHKEMLIVNGDHDGDSYLVAYDKNSGKELWKVPRAHKTRSYSVPRILPINGRDEIVLTGSYATSGFDASTGKLLWTVDGPSEQMVASILEAGDLLFAMGGYPERHLLAIKKGGSGDITQSHVVWRTHRSVPYVPSALLYDGILHVVSDEGTYTCYDPPTGKLHKQKRVSTHISGSIVGGARHVYITDDAGETTVLKNGTEFDVVSRNSVGENVYSSPAISGGSIFIRGDKHLFRIDGE